MPNIFADTAGWGHLVDRTQVYHRQASALYRQARQEGRTLITTNYILTELVALLTSPLRVPRPQLIAFIASLKAAPHVDIVHVDPGIDAQAWQLLTERPDKEWSLVNCTSFVIMRQRGLREAFTTDHHFEQAGIRLRRDNWVSVRYAERLNSTTSSVIFQRTDRHGILGQKPVHCQMSS